MYYIRSLGCIAYHLLCGRPPFDTNSLMHLVQMMKDQSIIWPNSVSPVCQNFLEQLLQKNPLERLTWPGLLEHDFVKNRVFTKDENENSNVSSRVEDIVSPLNTLTINEEEDEEAEKETSGSSSSHELTSIEDT